MSIHHKDIIFPSEQNSSISTLLSDLRRTTLTIHNRLTSIRADAEFVAKVSQSLGNRPLVANERCGSWYIPPETKNGSAYFKSTDGHERAWKFSTRRLNLHIAELADKHDGVVIVDSTRRGKRMPDALSTTIPIWCAVLNRAIFPSKDTAQRLFLPPYMSESTHAQITALLPSFVSSLQDLKIPLPSLTKPLRPFWITQGSDISDTPQSIFEKYTPIICCTASRRVVGSEMEEGGYIQGAADDTENWAHGLTAPIFWSNIDRLMETSESDLLDTIKDLVENTTATDTVAIRLAPQISVTALSETQINDPNTCCISLASKATPKETWEISSRRMEVGLGKSKAASRNLRLALPSICAFASSFMKKHTDSQLLILCHSGKDLSVGTALALHCFLFDDNEKLRPEDTPVEFTKSFIKSRLAGFMTTYPAANPSRTTLQSVNSFLMDWRN